MRLIADVFSGAAAMLIRVVHGFACSMDA